MCKDICMNCDTGSYFPLSSYDKLFFRDPAHFHRNDTSQRRVYILAYVCTSLVDCNSHGQVIGRFVLQMQNETNFLFFHTPLIIIIRMACWRETNGSSTLGLISTGME